uniref:volvatoxin A2 n=1 Tax=Volvariella volvacea TaxID=36659 RepID=UPI000044B4D7|nr:Chain A, volvatoxin A2 [Volvariella volvacea]
MSESELKVNQAVAAASDDNVFQPVDQLPEDLIPSSIQVLKFSGKYLKLEQNKAYFDWPEFKTAIDNYTGEDLSFDKYDQSTINQREQEVGSMVDKIAKFLRDAFSAVVDLSKLGAIILNTFTNLEEESSSGFLQFSTNNVKKNSSWEYRVLFSVPFGDNAPSYFYSLVTTILITADIEEKTGWWGLTSSTKKNFAVQIDALELVVKKGFKAPN